MTAAARGGGLAPLYAAALALSALLLFWIQPLFSKLVLPHYGGSPAVWTTTAMFFQVALLAGYLYAHALSRLPALRAQMALHGALLLAALATLPAGADATATAAAAPVVSLLVLLAAGVGLPFFALAATAPLLQQWLSRTRHPDATDPYYLYGASNAGGMAALAGYPLLIEPALGLRQQGLLWSALYALLAALIAACALGAWRQRLPAPPAAPAPAAAGARWRERGRWLLLAFAPSSLLLGVTQHITSEIAAVPLLWLVPLALYALTFIVAFARRPALGAGLVNRLQPALALLLALVWVLNTYVAVMALHLAVFFATAMMCHGELARRRPPVAQLTEFYLWLAAGGALGGVFNALVAPWLFDSVLEYPLALALACALRPAPGVRPGAGDVAPALALAGAAGALIAAGIRPFEHGAWAIVAYLQATGVALYLCWRRPLRFALALGVVLIMAPAMHAADTVLERHRSFFGVHSVLADREGRFHVLMHGITIHGAQYRDPARRLEPTAYYHRGSPIGQLFEALGEDGPRRVAALGMGLGTVACYRAPGREWSFYEIDPVVVRLALDRRYFHFLAECAPAARITVGDARLAFAAEPDAHFDLVIVDTFSSDAIPVHMITREAVALYLRKTAPGGVLMFHITNQYLDLAPVLATLAAEAGATALAPGPRLALQFGDRLAELPSSWVALARDTHRLQPLREREGWIELAPPAGARPWTDDYSNLLGALK